MPVSAWHCVLLQVEYSSRVTVVEVALHCSSNQSGDTPLTSVSCFSCSCHTKRDLDLHTHTHVFFCCCCCLCLAGNPQNAPYPPSVVGTPAMSGSGSVIMIYGLTPGKHNCDSVFNLLCSYGNVLKVTKTQKPVLFMEFWNCSNPPVGPVFWVEDNQNYYFKRNGRLPNYSPYLNSALKSVHVDFDVFPWINSVKSRMAVVKRFPMSNHFLEVPGQTLDCRA